MNIAYKVFHIDGISDDRSDATNKINTILSNIDQLDTDTINYFNADESDKFNEKYKDFSLKRNFKTGEIGVWASNYNAWHSFLNSDYDYLILFEDDAKIDDDFIDGITRYINELPEDWDFFSPFVHWWQQQNNYNKDKNDYGHSEICKAYQVWSLACYVVSKSGAEKAILEANKGIEDPVDWFIFKNTGRFNTYTLKPGVKQYCDINYFKTTIQDEPEYPNWFLQSAHGYFNKYLKEYVGIPNLKFLQIGAYTGDASVWILDNILTNVSSTLTDVDTWGGSDEGIHKQFNWDHLEKTYNNKVSKYRNIIKYKLDSVTFLNQNREDKYDFIYIDGDHTADGVYSDASLSWDLLQYNGIMAFDDYLWIHESGDIQKSPKPGIDKFLLEKEGMFDIIEKSYQVWIRKK